MRSSFEHACEIPALIEALDVPVATINPDDAPTDLVSMRDHGVDVVINAAFPSIKHSKHIGLSCASISASERLTCWVKSKAKKRGIYD